jgi:hypothetical protein
VSAKQFAQHLLKYLQALQERTVKLAEKYSFVLVMLLYAKYLFLKIS